MVWNKIINTFIGSIDYKVSEIENGLINNTFLVTTSNRKYILQKINTNIFKHPEILIENYLQVNKALQVSDYTKQIIALIPSLSGNYLVSVTPNEYWRMLDFVEQSKTFVKVPDNEIAFKAAACFSEFYKVLNNVEIKLDWPLPDFINFNKRVIAYRQALETADVKRIKKAEILITALSGYLDFPDRWYILIEKGLLPIRTIHGDPKISNILFNNTDDAIAVIDLDTVMNAPLLYDFGDMVRSYCNLTEEDDGVTENNFSLEIYNAVKLGFLTHLKLMLTPAELENMEYAAQLVVYVQALRFLTDYLNNDVYYKTNYTEHNLDRAKNQYVLFKQMLQQL